MDDHPLPYTLAGRVLLLICILLGCVGPCYSIYVLYESGWSGSYPIYMLVAPYIVGAVLTFFAGGALLRFCGIAVRKDEAP